MTTGPWGADPSLPAHGGDHPQCSACGEPLSAGANYCPRCGQPIGAPPTPIQETPAAHAPGSEFWAPPIAGVDQQFGQGSAFPPSRPIPLYRRRPLQIAAVAAVIAIGAVVFALASGGSNSKSGSSLATPAGADGVTTYKAGHFSAKFPSTPVETQIPSTFGNVHVVLHIASVRAPDVVAVEEADFNPGMPVSSFDTNLRTTLGGFAATSGTTLVSQSVTTFQGHAARKGEFTSPTGAQYEMVAFMTDGHREYVLVGPTGTYDELAASFTSLP